MRPPYESKQDAPHGAITVACIGFTVVTAAEDWEFWIPPLLIVGAAALWVMHFTQRGDERTRENFYFLYGLLAAFLHGVHESSIFDAAIVAAMMLALFSAIDRLFMLHTILAEYAVVMGVQFMLALHGGTSLGTLGVSSIALQITAVLCIYLICRRSVVNGLEIAADAERHKREVEENDTDTIIGSASAYKDATAKVLNDFSKKEQQARENSKMFKDEASRYKQSLARLTAEVDAQLAENRTGFVRDVTDSVESLKKELHSLALERPNPIYADMLRNYGDFGVKPTLTELQALLEINAGSMIGISMLSPVGV